MVEDLVGAVDRLLGAPVEGEVDLVAGPQWSFIVEVVSFQRDLVAQVGVQGVGDRRVDCGVGQGQVSQGMAVDMDAGRQQGVQGFERGVVVAQGFFDARGFEQESQLLAAAQSQAC
ncbi:MAG: hypothetical protein NTV69_18240, partial [Caldilinea sp.]|nr:hypothetical protein [Caldilinea sp.]